MNQLTENITNAAQTLQRITEKARRCQDEQRPDATISLAQASSLRLMQQKVWVDAHWPIAWPNWPPGWWAKITAVWQKLIRYMLRWYINPIVQQQNTCELLYARSLEQRVVVHEVQEPSSCKLRPLIAPLCEPDVHLVLEIAKRSDTGILCIVVRRISLGVVDQNDFVRQINVRPSEALKAIQGQFLVPVV